MCAEKGLYPIEIVDENQINVIIYYLNDISVDLMSPKAVPIGYDYSCLNVFYYLPINLK